MTDHAIENAKAWLEGIRGTAKALRSDNDESREAAIEEAQEQPLSIAVRAGWYSPGSEHAEPEEYEVLLSTGGPALRIWGGLDGDEPDDCPHLQWQDWGTPWTDLPLGSDDLIALRAYVGVFYFGG